MSIVDMANDAAARQAALDQLRVQALERASHSNVAVAGLSDEARGLLDRIDLSERKRHDAENTGAEARSGRPRAWKIAGASALLAAGGIACLATGTLPTAIAGAAAGVGGTVSLFSVLIASSAGYNIDWAQRETQKQSDDIHTAQQQLTVLAQNERAASETGLLEDLSAAGCAGQPAKSLINGAPSMILMRHMESDPNVAIPTLKLKKAESAVAHKDQLLSATRQELFAGEPERMQEAWGNVAQIAACLALLGSIGAGIGTGIGASLLLGPNIGIPIGGAAALGGAFAARKYVPALIARRVDHNMRRELTTEVAQERTQLDPLRQAVSAARDESVAHYYDFIATHPVPPAPSKAPEAQPGVHDGGDGVTIGDVRVSNG